MFTVTWSSTGPPANNNTDDNVSINIININRNNTGTYYCIASNGETAPVNVNVVCKLVIIDNIYL